MKQNKNDDKEYMVIDEPTAIMPVPTQEELDKIKVDFSEFDRKFKEGYFNIKE